MDAFVRARVGRSERFELDGLAVVVAAVQLERDLPQQRLAAFPLVERALQARDAKRSSKVLPCRVDHDERAITRPISKRAEPHEPQRSSAATPMWNLEWEGGMRMDGTSRGRGRRQGYN